jgi:putative FmdB family regulatory protein
VLKAGGAVHRKLLVPTYEYECIEHGHRFEEFQSMTDKPLKSCSVCGGKVRRLIGTGAGIIFKGSGFYETDYRSESYRKGEKAEESASSTSSGDSEKSDTGNGEGSSKSS